MTTYEEKKHLPDKKLRLFRRAFRFFWKTTLALLFLLLIFLIATNLYLQSEKNKIFSGLDFLNEGSLSFGTTQISLFKDFPKATITLNDVLVQDSLFSQHQTTFLQVRQLSLVASLKDLLDNKVEIESIRLEDGDIRLFTDANNYSNVKSLLNSTETKTDNKPRARPKKMNIALFNIGVHLTDAIKTQSIHGRFERLTAEVIPNEFDFSIALDMVLFLKEFAFKKRRGSFASNSRLQGSPTLKLKNGILQFDPFFLKINEETFLFSGHFDTSKKNTYNFLFENENTRLSQTIILLPKRIQEKLRPFHVANPFYSKVTIDPPPDLDKPPVIDIDFRFNENEVAVDTLEFSQVNLEGRFINRLYDDDRAREEGRKRFRLFLQNIDLVYEEHQVSSNEIYFHKTPETGLQLRADVMVNGYPKNISKWFDTDRFFLEDGDFQLKANIEGPVSRYEQIITESRATLALNDFSVIYNPSNTRLPFQHLALDKKYGEAGFTIVSSRFKKGHNFRIDGGLQNMHALLFDLPVRVRSNASLVADRISWEDFLHFFGKNGYLDSNKTKDDRQKKKSMKETIQGIQYNFQPQLSMEVDTLQYFDLLELNKFETGLHFEGGHLLVFEKTSFKYGKGKVKFKAKADLSQTDKTPFEFELSTKKLNLSELLPPLNYFNINLLANMEYLPKRVNLEVEHKGILDDHMALIPNTSTGKIKFKFDKGKFLEGKITYSPAPVGEEVEPDGLEFGEALKTKIELEGDPAFFNQFFKNDKFFFNKGRFSSEFKYKGNLKNIEELLSKGKGDLSLKKSEVYYKPADVYFLLDKMKLGLKKGDADFEVNYHSDAFRHKVKLKGSIENISELIVGNTGKDIETKVKITSPEIRRDNFISDFMTFGEKGRKNTNKPEHQTIPMLKSSAKGILSHFDPNINVEIDTLIYSDKLTLYDFKTGVHLKDTATLVLEKTAFKFHDGKLSVKGKFDLGQKGRTPFKGTLKTKQLKVPQFIASLELTGFPALRKLKILSGETTVDLKLNGIIDDQTKQLIPDSTKGTLEFELNHLYIEDFAPIKEIADKLMMKKRFKQIFFAPITNEVEIIGRDIHIPLMEIQSNAINFFIEGIYSFDNNTNLWVSIPIDNMMGKHKNNLTIPEKRGYDVTGKNIHLSITSKENGDNQIKFHFSKKQFYRERGLMEEYKLEKRKHRKTKRAWKRRN